MKNSNRRQKKRTEGQKSDNQGSARPKNDALARYGGEQLRQENPDRLETTGTESLRTQTILGMQSQQGNEIVQRMLKRAPESEHSGVVQRFDPEEEEAAAQGETGAAVTLQASEITLQPLWEYPIMITNPPTMNFSAQTLLGEMGRAETQSSDLRDELGYLNYAEETGSTDLTAVQEARGDLAEGSRGRSGEYLGTAIEDYTSANGLVQAELSDVSEKQLGIRQAAEQLNAVAIAGQVQESERGVASATSDVAGVQARIARAKGLARGLIGPAANLLQGKWRDAGIDLAKFVGSELVGLAIDSAYSSELQSAQADLRNAQEALVGFQNAAQASALEAAVLGLQRANQASATSQTRLMVQVNLAQLAERTLVEELERMGHGDAASALDARVSVMEASARTLTKLNAYQSLG